MSGKFLFVILLSLAGLQALSSPADKGKGIAKSCYALIISIAEYPKEASWPVANSNDDINNIKFFLNKIAPGSETKTLQDKAATRQNIIEGINYIFRSVAAGDKVYLHFSGGGMKIEDDNGDETDGQDEAFMPYDAPSFADVELSNKKVDLSKLIRDDELEEMIAVIRKKLGKEGQLLFSVDASFFGPSENTEMASIGRGGFFDAEDKEPLLKIPLSPMIMISSCLERERSMFLDSGKAPLYRSFSTSLRNFASKINSGDLVTYSEFFRGISTELKQLSPTQTPSMAGNTANRFVLNSRKKLSDTALEKIVAEDAKLYILSIGINSYNGPFQFKNCADDALLFTETVTNAFRAYSKGDIKTHLLLGAHATKDSIIKSISEIAIHAKDNDLFAFFFAGFTSQPEKEDGGYEETWFYPTTKKLISLNTRSGFAEKDVITLNELKKLLDYLKCDKQLLFTEAGPSNNFKREFVKSMIKTNPVIADIVKRNRVILVPTTSGLDNTICDGSIDHGPGLYYFNKLQSSGNNILQFFSSKKETRQNLVFNYNKLQNQCNYPKYEYMAFFFEKEFVEDLQYYFSKDDKQSKNRGVGEDVADKPLQPEVIKNKYALLIGTSDFQSWTGLDNPVNDASSIADTLNKLFGFKTKLLINPKLSEIYNALYHYNNLLKEDDQFLLYIAGHGYFDTTIYRDGFIVANDSKTLRADTFLTSYIPFSQLRNITDNFKSKQVMVMLDVCFSGAFDNNEDLVAGNINYNLNYKLDNNSVNKKLQMVTRKYITAGSRIEEVPDNFKGGHSPFAWFVLDGLRRAAREKKYLSSSMLFKFIQSYLEDTVPLQSGFGKDQLRLGSEFIFMSKQD